VSGAWNQVISGDYAYVGGSGIDVIDISIPSTPVVVGSVVGEIGPGVAIFGHYLYSGGSFSFCTIDVSDPTSPEVIGTIDLPFGGRPSDVQFDSELVYLISTEDGGRHIARVDVSDPIVPALAGDLHLGGDALYAFSISGDFAFVAHGYEGIDVVDISSPSSLTHVGNCPTANRALDIAIQGSYAYVADRYGGLQIVSLEDPIAPVIVGELSGLGHSYGIDVDGAFAYVTDQSTLYIVDVSDPTSPLLVGNLGTGHGYPYAYNVAVAGDLVCVVEGPNWFQMAPIQCSSNGTIIIDVEPSGIEALWSLTGPGGLSEGVSDSTLTEMTPGTYSMTWGEESGWITPAPDTLELVAGEEIAFLGTYEPMPDVETFAVTFGGSSMERGEAVLQTDDGGYLVAGRNNSWASNGEWLIKVDPTGSEEWNRHYQGAGYHAFKGVDHCSGGYILTGYSGGAYADMWLMKVNTDGDEIFNHQFNVGGTAWNDGASVKETSDGGFAVLGRTAWSWPNHAWYLVRTDANGVLLWEQVFNASEEDHDTEAGFDLQQTQDGGFILAGSYLDTPTDARLVKTDSSGNIEWSSTFGGSAGDYFRSVRILDNGDYLIAGGTASSGAGGSDGWLLRVDAFGSEIWSNTYGGSSDEGFAVAELVPDGGYILTGSTRSYGAGGSDLWLIKTNESGDVLWERIYGGSEDESGTDVKPATDGGYIVTGGTKSFAAGDWDVWLPKTDAEGRVDSLATSMPGDNVPSTRLAMGQNYPNPFNPKTSFRFEIQQRTHVRLEIIDIGGHRVATLVDGVLKEGSHAAIWMGIDDGGRRVSSGVYIARLSTEDEVRTTKIVLAK